ncbi:hypothetical protein AAC387_Pa01g0001 [Persea americana]
MEIVLNGLGQYWKKVEEYRLSQHLLKRQIASNAITPTPKLELEDDYVQLGQGDTPTDTKQKFIVINASIEVKFHQFKGDILYTQIYIASLDDLLIEALIDTGASTSFIKNRIIPDSLMTVIDRPVYGTRANDNEFVLTRQTDCLLLKIQDTLHKIKFLEIDGLSFIDALLGMDFLCDFESYTFQIKPTPKLLLHLRGRTFTHPPYAHEEKYLPVLKPAAKRGDTDREKATNTLNPKP